MQAAGLDDVTIRSLQQHRANTEPEAEMERLALSGVTTIPWNDPFYQPRLREIDERPPVLFMLGELTAQDE